ncbi:hypothetical protein ACN8ZM_39850 (plasmid) [Burkholderia aenigmatica]
MSDDAYCLMLVNRALSRSDAELFGHRVQYQIRARQLAERIISAGL